MDYVQKLDRKNHIVSPVHVMGAFHYTLCGVDMAGDATSLTGWHKVQGQTVITCRACKRLLLLDQMEQILDAKGRVGKATLREYIDQLRALN